MAELADLITSVRQQIPDPNADAFTDATLLLWINDGARLIATSAPVIQDWFALPTISGQDLYELPKYITNVEEVAYDLFPLTRDPEINTILPKKLSGRSWNFAPHSIHAIPVLSVWPAPTRSGGVSVLAAAITATENSLRTNPSMAGLLDTGFVRVTTSSVYELIAYRSRGTPLEKIYASERTNFWAAAEFTLAGTLAPFYKLSANQDWVIATFNFDDITGFPVSQQTTTVGETATGASVSSLTFDYTLPDEAGVLIVMTHVFQAAGAVPTVSSVTVEGATAANVVGNTTLNRRRLEGRAIKHSDIPGSAGTKEIVVTLSASATEVYVTTLFQRGVVPGGSTGNATGNNSTPLGPSSLPPSTISWLITGNVNAAGVTTTEPSPGGGQSAFTNVLRGQGGTLAASHSANDVVEECNLIMRVFRLPRPVTATTDPFELPSGLWPLLELWCIAKVRESEQDHNTALQLRQEFLKLVDELGQKHSVKGHRQGIQVRERPVIPELYFGRRFIV